MPVSHSVPKSRRRLLYGTGASAFVVLIALGVFASNGWFPRTDAFSGKRYGWFGQPLAKNAPSSWNPLAVPDPPPTPQLAREYVYAGSRLLTVEDKNATAAPPADLAVWRPGAQGVWYVRISGSEWVTQNWGVTGDIPVPGDFDGDGTTDFSVWRPSNYTWYVVNSSTGGQTGYAFGASGDIPASGDYDGDGKTDPAVYRPPAGGATYGIWYVQGSTAGFYSHQWGESGDLPASADYDGDGRADVAVWRPSDRTFYSVNSSNGAGQTVPSGLASGFNWCAECVVSSDYDGDGRADYAVFDQAAANWYIHPSSGGSGGLGGTPNSSGFVTLQWGNAADKPVHNDYDSDARCDLATWRNANGTWYIRQSSLLGQAGELRQVQWGQSGDVPVPAFFRR